jgi:hypothetical protein
MDGFDKYGGVNNNATTVSTLMAGEWTTITNVNIGAPLSSTGQSVNHTGGLILTKTLASAVGRIIGGVRFSSTLIVVSGVQFLDAGTAQCGIAIATTGVISLRNGVYNTGTILGSATAIGANTTHYLEWDIALGNSAAYTVYLDGVSVISGTGDTTATANNTINGVSFQAQTGTGITIDDFYLFDTSGSTNNAVLLTSPRIETTFPVSDSSVQFSVGAGILGSNAARLGTSASPGTASSLMLRRFTPVVSGTLNSISIIPNITSGTLNFRPAAYADSSGTAGSLLSSGSTVTGATAGTTVTMPLTTPQSLTAGTQYWLAVMVDANSNMQGSDSLNLGYNRTGLTFASGAPNPAGTITSGAGSYLIWGNLSGISGANYYEVSQIPTAGAASYLTDTTVGHEDLFVFPNLATTPTVIYAVALKANCSRSDAGARTVSMRMLSAGTDSGGTATGQTPGTSYGWLTTLFETDPHTTAAWLPANLNASTSGFKIDA